MQMTFFRAVLKATALLFYLLGSTLSHAEVVAIEIASRQPWAGGQTFGKTGSYELLRGTVRYAIDPRSPAARDIADIRLAAVNANGLVEYSGPFVMLRPQAVELGNRATLIEAVNRGRTQMDGAFFETGDGLNLMTPQAVEELSDTTLFELGYTVAWVGWQGRMGGDEFGLQVPVARVHGLVRATFPGGDMTAPGNSFDLPANGFYCARDAEQANAVLRQQTRFDDPGTVVPRSLWHFVGTTGNPDARCTFALKELPEAGAYFTLIYEGENPAVMGLGQAAFRDFAAHLKYRDNPSVLNSRMGESSSVFAFGYSQGGRFLRDFVYRGFNAGPGGKRVFDGMLVATAGAGRGSFNHRYALPGEAGNSVMSNLRAVDLYPFADMPTPDIDGEGNAGLLDRAVADDTVPKIFNIISSSEYWARVASLLQTSTEGSRAVDLGPQSRLYYFSGVAHSLRRPESYTEAGKEAAYPYNANIDLADGMNAQLENLRNWAVNSIPPPPTIAPVLGQTLVDARDLRFPPVPGVRAPTSPPPLWKLDLGRDYSRAGIITEPVRIGARYPILVPAVDVDGNELGGWRGPMSSVPLGTFTAWNWRLPEQAPFGFISGLNGAFIPFARTREERLLANDPRASIEERYANRDAFLAAAASSVDDAIARRFLLPMQRGATLAKMGKLWDDVMRMTWHLQRTRGGVGINAGDTSQEPGREIQVPQ